MTKSLCWVFQRNRGYTHMGFEPSTLPFHRFWWQITICHCFVKHIVGQLDVAMTHSPSQNSDSNMNQVSTWMLPCVWTYTPIASQSIHGTGMFTPWTFDFYSECRKIYQSHGCVYVSSEANKQLLFHCFLWFVPNAAPLSIHFIRNELRIITCNQHKKKKKT